MLIKCPDCKKDVSSHAEMCVHCGYPLEKMLPKIKADFEAEVSALLTKIKPVQFRYSEPHVKVCSKCGKPWWQEDNKPHCRCRSVIGEQYPAVEVDYRFPKEMGAEADVGRLLYIFENCIVPMNIGDIESPEYEENRKELYQFKERCEYAQKREIKPLPPEEEGNLKELLAAAPTQISDSPKCPICGSTNLSRITAGKKATKIAVFGIFGMDDTGKSWKCNKCGSKF